MATLVEDLMAYIARPEIAEKLRQLNEAAAVAGQAASQIFSGMVPMAATIAAVAVQTHSQIISGMVLMAATIAQRAEEKFPSKAYGQYLKDRGVNPFWAQGLGSLAISLGTRTANKSRQLAKVVEALRFLAQRNRRKGAILSRARELLAAGDESSILDEIFRKAGLDGTELSELVYLLKGAVNGGPLERERIREIAAAVVPSLPSARGRKVSAASAAHEEFLKFAEHLGYWGYTYSDLERDFVDERTKATRLEFGDPDFDPRPAYQRFAARRKARSS
jgi:hypothetical protein